MAPIKRIPATVAKASTTHLLCFLRIFGGGLPPLTCPATCGRAGETKSVEGALWPPSTGGRTSLRRWAQLRFADALGSEHRPSPAALLGLGVQRAGDDGIVVKFDTQDNYIYLVSVLEQPFPKGVFSPRFALFIRQRRLTAVPHPR